MKCLFKSHWLFHPTASVLCGMHTHSNEFLFWRNSLQLVYFSLPSHWSVMKHVSRKSIHMLWQLFKWLSVSSLNTSHSWSRDCIDFCILRFTQMHRLVYCILEVLLKWYRLTLQNLPETLTRLQLISDIVQHWHITPPVLQYCSILSGIFLLLHFVFVPNVTLFSM